jgi:hypothetical protein
VIPSLVNIPSDSLTFKLNSETEASLTGFLKHQKRDLLNWYFLFRAMALSTLLWRLRNWRTDANEDIGLLLLDGSVANDPEYRWPSTGEPRLDHCFD